MACIALAWARLVPSEHITADLQCSAADSRAKLRRLRSCSRAATCCTMGCFSCFSGGAGSAKKNQVAPVQVEARERCTTAPRIRDDPLSAGLSKAASEGGAAVIAAIKGASKLEVFTWTHKLDSDNSRCFPLPPLSRIWASKCPAASLPGRRPHICPLGSLNVSLGTTTVLR